MNIRNPNAPRARIERELASYYPELPDTDEPELRFSVARAIEEMCTERGLHSGYEREVCGSAALISGRSHDPHRVIIPFAALATRDMTKSGDGAYLVGTVTPDPFDVLRPWSVAAQAGVASMTNLRENISLPRVSGTSTPTWIAEDGVSQYPKSQPSLGSVALSPKVASVMVDFSHQFARQVPGAELFLRRQLLSAVGELLDGAFFAGSGNSGQPLGMLNTANIGAQSGTSLAHAGLLAMRQSVLTAGGRQENLRWVGPPAMQTLLGARDRIASGGRFLWDDQGILGAPAHCTKLAPAGTLIAGDFSKAVVALWGAGLRLELDPYSAFRTGVTTARVVLDVDVAFPQPGAFSVATSIT